MATEVSASSAIIWSRASGVGRAHIQLLDAQGSVLHSSVTPLEPVNDYTATLTIEHLNANTQYFYTVNHLVSAVAESTDIVLATVNGSFRSAPAPQESSAISVAFTGDFAGQNVCRDVEEGFVLLPAIVKERVNLFIGLGDMIYADDLCDAIGRYGNRQIPGKFGLAASLSEFHAHWRYTRGDAGMRELLLSTPYAAVWDDHEVVNDFGPLHDTRDQAPYQKGQSLLPLGLRAFLDYNPMHTSLPKTGLSPQPAPRLAKTPSTHSIDANIPRKTIDSEGRLYRSSRWGRHLELFFLDTRQYRDDNQRMDDQPRPKTLLGRAQREWLIDSLQNSDATWKVIVSSVPLSIPTGWPRDGGRDGWADFAAPAIEKETLKIGSSEPLNANPATGFERELMVIVSALHAAQANVLFISTDVHFAEVFRYTPFMQSPAFKLHEMVVGPGSAGLYPSKDFDATLNPERLFFYGPESADSVTTWQEARHWFNYGIIDVSRTGELNLAISDLTGRRLYRHTLYPTFSP